MCVKMQLIVSGHRGRRGPSVMSSVAVDFSQELVRVPRRRVQATINSGTLVILCLVMVSQSVSQSVCLSVCLQT